MSIPRAMSTQHPDNAFPAPFSENGVLKGEGEIAEASWAWSTLLCDEQMWDYEGKAADVDVIMKLLMRDPEYFRTHVLGSDVFLTLRIPNPSAEREMRKKLEEALHTIVTSYDIAAGFHDYVHAAHMGGDPPLYDLGGRAAARRRLLPGGGCREAGSRLARGVGRCGTGWANTTLKPSTSSRSLRMSPVSCRPTPSWRPICRVWDGKRPGCASSWPGATRP